MASYIQHLDDPGLNISVGHIVKGIDPDHRAEDLIVGRREFSVRISLRDLRDREGDNGKAPFLSYDRAVIKQVCLLAEAGDLFLLCL